MEEGGCCKAKRRLKESDYHCLLLAPHCLSLFLSAFTVEVAPTMRMLKLALCAADVEAPLFYPPPPLAVDSSTTRAETTAKQRSQSEPCKLALD